jgi:hypothetical protein
MKRLAVLVFFGAVGAALGAVLWVRFRNKGDGDGAETAKGKGARTKQEHRDFAKSAAGLIRTSTIEEGSKLNENAPETSLGAYVALREGVLKKWRETKISVEWDSVTAAEGFADLASRYGLDVRLDPATAGNTLTMRVEDLEAISALDLITKMSGQGWVVNMSGELWIFPAEKSSTYVPPSWLDLEELFDLREAVLADRNAGVLREPAMARKVRETALAGRGVPAGDLVELLDFLGQVTDVNYVIRPTDKPPTLPALASLEGESLEDFLKRALEPVGYTFRAGEDSVEILTQDALEEEKKKAAAGEDERKVRLETEAQFFTKPVTVGGDNLSLKDLAEALGQALGVPTIVDPKSSRRSAWYTFKAIERPAAEVISILKKGAPVEVTWRDGKLWILAPEDLHAGR